MAAIHIRPCPLIPFNKNVVRDIRKNDLLRDIKAKHSVDIRYERDEYDTSRMIFNIYGGDRCVGDACIELLDMYKILVYKYNRKQEQKGECGWNSIYSIRVRIAELLGMKQEDIPLDMVVGYQMKDKL